MSSRWAELDLGACRVVDAHGNDYPVHESEQGTPITVSLGLDNAAETTLDMGRLAHVLLPTLSDIRAATLCSHFGLTCSESPTVGELAALLESLLTELLTVDRDVLSLLSQLMPEPYASVLQQSVLRTSPDEPVDVQPEPPRSEGEPLGTVNDILGMSGPLAEALSAYESRPGQLQMARAVDHTFIDGGACVVEAGPGTGKTFAYLVPALLTLARSSARVVVSTRTKQLQEQLYTKDLPFLLETLGVPIRVELLKGRSNYLCLRRWQQLIGELTNSLDRVRLAKLAPLVRWIMTTATGDIEENTAFLAQPGARALWSEVCDSPRFCTDQFCPHEDTCFAITARRRARAADLVVINHALLLGDIATGGMVLGKYSHLIIDEGHALEAAARSAFTRTLSQESVDRLADEFAPMRRRRHGWLSRLPINGDSGDVRRCSELLSSARARSAQLFQVVGPQLEDERSGRSPQWESSTPFAELSERLRDVGRSVESLLDEIDEPELTREGEGLLTTTDGIADLATTLMRAPEENEVHWYERDRFGIHLHVSPLDVAPLLADQLYPGLHALLLTSATLSLDGDFSYLSKSLGLDDSFERVEPLVVPSPFSHEERMRIYVPRYFPEATAPIAVYAERIAELVVDLVQRTGRKALVLCTSYRLLHAVRDRIPASMPTLSQGIDGPRSVLISRFRAADEPMILLGADSFWEGVDLPRDALEILVITRLPFPVPTDPIQAALAERHAQRGGDPFFELAIPQAVLRLRQGVGRLIRTQQDHGIAVITDHRLLSRSYGRRFVHSLPVPVRSFTDATRLIEDASQWFADAPTARIDDRSERN